MKKGAVELSVNFLVLLIIAIVVFGLSLTFVYRMMAKAEDIRKMSEDEMDSKIEGILCEEIEKVCLPRSVQTISRGGAEFFGLRLRNIFTERSETEFTINVEHGSEDGVYGYSGEDNVPIRERLIWQPTEPRTVILKANEMKNIGIAGQVPKTALPGKYFFTATVQSEQGVYSISKFYVNVP